MGNLENVTIAWEYVLTFISKIMITKHLSLCSLPWHEFWTSPSLRGEVKRGYTEQTVITGWRHRCASQKSTGGSAHNHSVVIYFTLQMPAGEERKNTFTDSSPEQASWDLPPSSPLPALPLFNHWSLPQKPKCEQHVSGFQKPAQQLEIPCSVSIAVSAVGTWGKVSHRHFLNSSFKMGVLYLKQGLTKLESSSYCKYIPKYKIICLLKRKLRHASNHRALRTAVVKTKAQSTLTNGKDFMGQQGSPDM